jgi:hypothetical protein
LSKNAKVSKNKAQLKLMNRFSEFSALHDVALQIWVTCVTITKCEKKVHDETKMKNILYLLGKTVNFFKHFVICFAHIIDILGNPDH